ncbi:helix-turn-helix domain-containing protein, partial [Klebsiella pneumoniae]
NSLGNKIKTRRQELGLDQVQLAKSAGISQPTLANLESGKNKRSKFLPEIAQALGLSLAELMQDEPANLPL